MKILCLDQFPELGGAQRSLLDLLPGFIEKGWRAEVFLPGPGAFSNALVEQGHPVTFYKACPYSSSRKTCAEMLRYTLEQPGLALQINRAVLETGASLFYVNGPRVLPAAALVARLHGIPLIFHSHNKLLQRSALTLTRAALRLSSAHLIACCGYVAAPLRSVVSSRKLSTVYNGVAAPSFRRQSRFPLRRIGVLGRVEPEKGQLAFIRAARLLIRDFPDCTFRVIGAPLFSGDSYGFHVRQEASDLPVEFPGWQSDPLAALAGLDLLVVPSTPVEATTRVIIEAYAAGVPVVAFPSGGIPEIVLDQRTGFLASDHTPEALAARIGFAIRLAPSKINAILKNARDAWRSRFTLGRYRDQVCAIVSSLLAERGELAYTTARMAR